MQWIKEVEMVDSVDDLGSSLSTRGISMPNFEVLDARIASALNKIIHNSHFKRRISLEEQEAQKQDRFLRGRQIAYLIYDYFWVTGIHDSVENYADLFTISLRNDDIQEFDSKWDGILLSLTKIPPDDILERLYKLRIRESEKLKTVLHQTQCTVCLSYWNIGILYCTCGHFLHMKKEEPIKKSSVLRWTFSQSLSMSSRKEDLMRYGKKPGDKEYWTAYQLKKKCKKRDFQGIHDRFIRDQEFRSRMIENHRDKELCRRWDALADEDHTHHLTAQEYLHF